MNELPEPGEPLVLANGVKIDTATGRKITDRKLVEVPRHSEARDIVLKTRRKLVDLPEPPKTMNPIAVIVTYHLFGLDVKDIALALGVSEEQVSSIMLRDAFTSMKDKIVSTISDGNVEDVRQYIASKSKHAAEKMVSLLDSEDEKITLAAANSVLDRSGHRPADIIEHRHTMQNELVIKVVKPVEQDLTLGLEAVEIENGDGS